MRPGPPAPRRLRSAGRGRPHGCPRRRRTRDRRQRGGRRPPLAAASSPSATARPMARARPPPSAGIGREPLVRLGAPLVGHAHVPEDQALDHPGAEVSGFACCMAVRFARASSIRPTRIRSVTWSSLAVRTGRPHSPRPGAGRAGPGRRGRPEAIGISSRSEGWPVPPKPFRYWPTVERKVFHSRVPPGGHDLPGESNRT